MQLGPGFLLVTDILKLSALGIDFDVGDILCPLSEIEDGAAKEFTYRNGKNIYDIFIQRQGEAVFAYTNVCPHAGTPLNMDTGKFMEKTGQYLMCHTHGALFQLDDGLCVAGPCNGAQLTAVDLAVHKGNITVG